jgi:hypothetical protein
MCNSLCAQHGVDMWHLNKILITKKKINVSHKHNISMFTLSKIILKYISRLQD